MATAKLFQPRYLYRYRAWKDDQGLDQEISCIRNKSLWCSNFRMLNDPMEGNYDATLRLKRMQEYREVRDKLSNEKMALGICSFSETNDNGVMWAHYANQFAGICIEYDFRKLLRYLPETATFVRVSYNEKTIEISSHETDNTEIAQRILSSKGHRWLYEREWRVFCPNPGIQLLSKNCISRVYLGNRIDTSAKEKISAALSELGIPTKRMRISGYEIKFSKQEPPKRVNSHLS